MKNAIQYYYNLYPDDIHQKKSRCSFTYNQEKYVLMLYSDDISLVKVIYDFHIFLLNNGIYVHQIILNRNSQILTTINNEEYVLLKISSNIIKRLINLNDIKNFSFLIIKANQRENHKNKREKTNDIFKILGRENLFLLWSNKNDHLEYQISQIGLKYHLISESFHYYIGLGETAIQLINQIPTANISSVAHKRLDYKSTLFDLYNPLNLIIDSRVRDAAEFFKSSFFYKKDLENEKFEQTIYSFLASSRFTNEEYIIFFARMLYPTYYFDLYELIIIGKENEEAIKKITSKAADYEILLRNIYRYYRSFIQIDPIEWLEKL